MKSFLTGQKGASLRWKFCPGGGGGGEGAVNASFFECMTVSVSVADLGALATDGLICCAFVGVVVFKFVASETGDKFSELLLLAL